MSIGAALESLLSDVTSPLRTVLRRAYELGYREGLASRTVGINGRAEPNPGADASQGSNAGPELVGATTAAGTAPTLERDTTENFSSNSLAQAILSNAQHVLSDGDNGLAAGLIPHVPLVAAIEATPPTEFETDGESNGDVGEPAEVEWATDDEPEREPEAAHAARDGAVVRPIWPHATVGTLRTRIIKIFGLERFDVEVIICKKGDTARRQLKGSARLKRYLLEE